MMRWKREKFGALCVCNYFVSLSQTMIPTFFKTRLVFLFRCIYMLIYFNCGNRLFYEHTLTEWQNEESKTNHRLKNPFGKILFTFFFISILLLLLLWRRTHTQSQATARFTSCESNRNTLLSSLIALTVVFSFTLSVVWCVRMESTLINTGPRFLFLPTKKIMSHSHLK